MDFFAYTGVRLPIPVPMRATHTRVWNRLAAPGTWWNGSERVAIAAETRAARDCRLCRERKAALSASRVEGEHDGPGTLPAAAVEAVHRIATDPARLSRSWFEQTLSAGLSDGQYVELLAIVAMVVNLDALHRGLGIAAEPLPEAKAGSPTRRRPPVETTPAWVPMIRLESMEAKELYGGRSLVPNVIRALSLVPEAVRDLSILIDAHYLTVDDVLDPSAQGRHLSRPQMELVAGRISAINECFY